MGKQQSKEVEKEEVFITQSGQNNYAPNNIAPWEKSETMFNLIVVIAVICGIIFAYSVYKKMHKRLTKKIQRQATEIVLKSRRASV
ncbi:unnamed protein product [Colias eurytheme]|nr:unnamed protein product [Colias eurytheme]